MENVRADLQKTGKRFSVRSLNKRNALLVTLIASGVLVRLVFAMILPVPAFLPRIQHETDAIEYFAIARNLTTGKGFSLDGQTPTAFRPPVYPLLIALCQANPQWVTFLHLVGSGFSSWLVWRLAGRVLQNEYRALAAVGLYAIYGEFVAYDMLFIAENVFMLGLLGSIEIVFMLRQYPQKTILLGILAGCSALTALTRPIGFYLFPVLFVMLAVFRVPGFNWRRIGIMLCIFFLVLSPWFWRNYTHFHKPVFVTNGGSNLYFGNLRDGTKGWASQPDDLRPAGNEAQKDAIYRAEALIFMQKQWKTMPLLWFRKFLRLWLNLDYGHDYRWSYPGMFVTLSRLLLFALFSATMYWWRSLDSLFVGLLLFLIIFFTGLHVVIYASPRFFIPVLPFMLIAILSGGVQKGFRIV